MEMLWVFMMSKQFFVHAPSMPRPSAEFVRFLGDRYETCVRLALGREEFVCILAHPERCYRADSPRN